MIETLFHAYTPLVIWTGLGLLVFRYIPVDFPKLLSRFLFWIGIPLQIAVLARQSDFSGAVGFTPAIAIFVLFVSTSLAWLTWVLLRRLSTRHVKKPYFDGKHSVVNLFLLNINSLTRSSQGSFILAAMLGNTGFVGLAITPAIISSDNNNWAVLYSVTNNVMGSYGFGVFLASYFGNSDDKNHWWIQLRDVLTVPAIWGFIIGFFTRNIPLPEPVESGLQTAVLAVIASALVLVGIRLRAIKTWQSFELALVPSLLKVVIVPVLIGLGASFFGLSGDPRFVLVLMSGTPTALSVLILAEIYELDRDLLASSIALTSVGLLLMLPLWLACFI
ncbi:MULTISPECIES: AEC family transporter [unclassified Microcoleus]|uniref:AEC family transporter n=1 Tax=unclassified Microcoleus TaxID=2642155 RepID=UPI001D6F904D|nr:MULTISPECIES: AEC family transporter [unclassified Microcoleus]MCC3471151.1 AEC family transporter [Microcoleus sp. PH2017_13_LAR_U_A]MCC3483807.1 AEC family transporter [Microcoleus sp. PH2017_14_LAR_D_A]MCC3583180.1 AEC family transporter [Microcoleus sp. PH2017_30_WIL_O_A]MCC3596312.1 AEC family transporter [Microcoleus sp. PH2017_26_ELK_O_A]MCC3621193.1 AEC family transporter [Microcoleus sp. PH2017_36_ELK_O_B]